MRTGTANLPLHGGHCPPWLFAQMKRLAAAITEVIVLEFGPEEMLRRLSDPHWFQAFGCVLGFDWHSSGLTTVVCGALKEGLAAAAGDLGLVVAGGKGNASRKTPAEIEQAAERLSWPVDPAGLVYASRLAAKVDNAAVQDGYQIYHHVFIFTRSGAWSVVQQGLNEQNKYARRYHWLSESLQPAEPAGATAAATPPNATAAAALRADAAANAATRAGAPNADAAASGGARPHPSMVDEPHAAVCCDSRGATLNLTHRLSAQARKTIAALARESPGSTLKELQKLRDKRLDLPAPHPIPSAAHLDRVLHQVYERRPEDFEALLGLAGVGPGTLRALAMVAEVAYGAAPSREDPVRYAFAHGGKDGFPFPVARRDYQRSIEALRGVLDAAKVERSEKLKALRRLAALNDSAAGGAASNRAAP